MKVLFVSPAAELGGAERCLLDFISVLVSAQVTVSLLSLAEGPLVRQARALGAEVEVITPPRELSEFGESAGRQSPATLLRQASAGPSTLRFLALLRSAIARRRPDVVHSNGMKAHVLACLLTPSRSRLVVHLHDFVGSRRAAKRLLPALARIRGRTVFVANSRAVARDFQRLAPRSDVRTVYNVVDVAYFRPETGEPSWLAELASMPPPEPSTVSFGLVATYARWKGHSLFIDAAGRLLAARPDLSLRFYVVGGPIYSTVGSQVSASELLHYAQAAGLARSFGLVPFQADIARVYRALNVVVHASTEPEPFGRSIVEAMACGCPVIVSSAGGAAELFQHGENAWGFSPGKPDALARAMGALCEQGTRARLGAAARSHAVLSFSRDRLASELLALYRA